MSDRLRESRSDEHDLGLRHEVCVGERLALEAMEVI